MTHKIALRLYLAAAVLAAAATSCDMMWDSAVDSDGGYYVPSQPSVDIGLGLGTGPYWGPGWNSGWGWDSPYYWGSPALRPVYRPTIINPLPPTRPGNAGAVQPTPPQRPTPPVVTPPQQRPTPPASGQRPQPR